MKKTIIHFIFSLERGGAETMVVRVIKELPEYRHVVISLYPENHFGDELQCDKLICLNIKSLLRLPIAVRKFRKVVKEENAAIVHTHLFWPTFVARFAVSKNIPLITTIHQFINSSVEYRHWYIRFLDKFSYKRRKSIIIVVAKGAMEEYFSFLKMKPYKAYVLYTFVDIDRFKTKDLERRIPHNGFKMIAVGALREQKNFSYLIKAMSLIKDHDISIDIYGAGNLQKELQDQISSTGANVTLKGQVSKIEEVIPLYDMFVMPSTYEGFSLGVLEAMAMEMPLLLSNNSSFKEQAADTAWYFSLSDVQDLADRIIYVSKLDIAILSDKAKAGKDRAVSNFTLSKHIQALRNIYNEALAG